MSGISTNGLTAATLPLTGSETAAFDTQLTQGLAPESVAISVSQLTGFARPPVALTDGTTIAVNAALASLFTVTLGGNRTLSNPTSLQSGQAFRVKITQDGTGARLLAFGTAYKFSGSSTLTTTIGAVDMIQCVYDGANALCTLSPKFV